MEPERIFTGRRLIVDSAGDRYVLAMKLVSHRQVDEADCEMLIRALSIRSQAELLDLIEQAIPAQHLPPTMAPAAASGRDDYLEHPDEVFSYFRRAGVDEVVVQEKHMGSRAVVVVARNADAARSRFGISNTEAGVIVTRTGRPFFAEAALTGALLERVRGAAAATGLWDRLSTDWLILDAEVLPWSAKAAALIQQLYAASSLSASRPLTGS